MSSAEDMSLLTTSTPASPSEPLLEERPNEPEEAEAPQSNPPPAIKTNMVAHEVRMKATWVHPDTGAGERELFTEETSSVLVCENGGVIQLSAAVAPGQLLLLTYVESKREVVAQVKRKRAYRPTSCFVELEFAEPAPRFWGMEFSAASALLPKKAQDAEAAARVGEAEATADEPSEPPPAPAAVVVQALKRDVEALRERSQSTQTPSASEQAPAPIPAVIPDAPPTPAAADVPSTESNSNSRLDETPDGAFPTESLPVEHDPVPAQWTAEEQVELPKPSLDFSMSLPKAKRSLRARGSFTPSFRGGVLRLALLTTALVATAVGAAWYKHWIPWRSAAKEPSVSISATAANTRESLQPGSHGAATEHPEFINARVASDAPVTSPGMPSQSAAQLKTLSPKPAGAVEPPAQTLASGDSVAQQSVKKISPSTTLAEKRSTAHPTERAVSDSVAPSAPESVMVPPKLIKSVRAVASLDALRDFETGNVVIDAVVGTSGEVNFVSVLSGPPSLHAAAVESLKHYQYEPATRNGQPVPAHVNITIHFRFEP